MELPYNFEQYVHARGTILARNPPSGTSPEACFSLARDTATKVFGSSETRELNASEIDKIEQKESIEPLTKLPAKLPPPITSEVTAAEAADKAMSPSVTAKDNNVQDANNVIPTPVAMKKSNIPRVDSFNLLRRSPKENTDAKNNKVVPPPLPLTSATGFSSANRPTNVPIKKPAPRKPSVKAIDDPRPIAKASTAPEPVVGTNLSHPTTAKPARRPPLMPAGKHPPGTFAGDKDHRIQQLKKRQAEEELEESAPIKKPRKAATNSAAAKGHPPANKSAPIKAPKKTLEDSPPPGAGKGAQLPVINGDSLPQNPAQAKACAKLRRARLERYVAMEQAKKGKGVARKTSDKKKKSKAAVLELMPEFFELKGLKDLVRCACGVTEDDGRLALECIQCHVWQHVECMGEGVPDDYENEDYTCHQCDPWLHRRLIARLRRERSISDHEADV